MTIVVVPLIVGEHTHGEMLGSLAVDRKINAGAATCAKAGNASVLQLRKELGVVSLAVLQEPLDDSRLIGSQWAIRLDVCWGMAHRIDA
jgi:hypothetical protein